MFDFVQVSDDYGGGWGSSSFLSALATLPITEVCYSHNVISNELLIPLHTVLNNGNGYHLAVLKFFLVRLFFFLTFLENSSITAFHFRVEGCFIKTYS